MESIKWLRKWVMLRNDLLNSAKEKINVDRADVYGDAKLNHKRIADGWNVIINSVDGEINEGHVALMMDWVKTSRLLSSMDHKDSWEDKIGYSALGGEFMVKEDNNAKS